MYPAGDQVFGYLSGEKRNAFYRIVPALTISGIIKI